MSILDKVVAAVTPPESDESRRKARAKARAAAEAGDWLSQILDHHEEIDAAFAAVRAAQEATLRRTAQMELAVLLSAHANAEEAVIYPALIHFGHKMHGTAGYTEQAGAKANLGQLEYLDPMSQAFLDKLEHIRGAVAHHVYEEENDRFLDLKKLTASEQEWLTQRYAEEFDRFCGSGMDDAGEPRRANELQDATLRPTSAQ